MGEEETHYILQAQQELDRESMERAIFAVAAQFPTEGMEQEELEEGEIPPGWVYFFCFGKKWLYMISVGCTGTFNIHELLLEEPVVHLDKENLTPFLEYPTLSSTAGVIASLPAKVDLKDDSGSFRTVEEDPRETKRAKIISITKPEVDSEFYRNDAQYHLDVVNNWEGGREVMFWGMPGEPQFLQYCRKYGKVYEIFDPTGFIRKHYEELEKEYKREKYQKELESF